MAGKLVLTKKVNAKGHILGLKPLAGREVLVIPLPRIRVKVPDVPAKDAAKDLREFAAAHADLARKQTETFLDRYGNPVEEAQKRVRRVQRAVETRVVRVKDRVRNVRQRKPSAPAKTHKRAGANGKSQAGQLKAEAMTAAGSNGTPK